jgi:hypothetical protein
MSPIVRHTFILEKFLLYFLKFMIKNSCCCVIHVDRTECRIEEERSARTGMDALHQMAAFAVTVIVLVFAVLHYCWQLLSIHSSIHPSIHYFTNNLINAFIHLSTTKISRFKEMFTVFADYYLE